MVGIRVPRPRILARRASSAKDKRQMQCLKKLLHSRPFVKKAPRAVARFA